MLDHSNYYYFFFNFNLHVKLKLTERWNNRSMLVAKRLCRMLPLLENYLFLFSDLPPLLLLRFHLFPFPLRRRRRRWGSHRGKKRNRNVPFDCAVDLKWRWSAALKAIRLPVVGDGGGTVSVSLSVCHVTEVNGEERERERECCRLWLWVRERCSERK